MLICFFFCILNTDLSLFVKIHLSSDQQFSDTPMDLSKGDLHPFGHIFEWAFVDDGKHENNSINSSKEAFRHIDISFLPSRIPNLQFNIISPSFNLFELIVNPDSRGHTMGKCLRTKTVYYTCLSYTWISYHDYFKRWHSNTIALNW